MASGKLLAIIGAFLTIIGMYLFTLYEFIPPTFVGGASSLLAIDDVFQLAVANAGDPNVWILWVSGIVGILYFLSAFVQLLGIKSKIASLLGSIIPLTVIVFIILAIAGAWAGGIAGTLPFLHPVWGTSFTFPFTFEYSFMPGGIGWGTYLVGLGSILSFVATFLPRENY
jgi:hypothetical protein